MPPKCACMKTNRPRRSFGALRVLPSGMHHARYRQPGTKRWINAPTTFETHLDAEMWLSTVRGDIARGVWMPPSTKTTFGDYADTWLAHRTVKGRPLRPRTRAMYRSMLDRQILPAFGDSPIRAITPAAVRDWHSKLPDHPTLNARAYALLKTILATAVDDDLIVANPCRIRGASTVSRASKTEPASLEELTTIVGAVPQRYRLMVLLAAWCALRFGELTELRGRDVNTRTGVIHVARGVVWLRENDPVPADAVLCTCQPGKHLVGPTKSDAGVRDVNIPPHLLPDVRAHILAVGAGRDGLLFPARRGGHMRPSALYKVYNAAREDAGRPDLRFHDLRHTGAVLAAATGATLAELMARLGHSTPAAAMRYQHAAKGRDAEIAKALSTLAGE